MTRSAPNGLPVAPSTTIEAALRLIRDTFRAAGLDTAELESRDLVGRVLQLDLTGLVISGGRPLKAEEADRLSTAASRRLTGEPLARIFGEAEFWGMPFRLGPDTLVPRADTETVIRVAMARGRWAAGAPIVADLGTGSGAILAALLVEWPQALGLGTDVSPGALAVAADNLGALGLSARGILVRASFADALATGRFDVIASNPPYIARAVIPDLMREVRDHDPRLALDGGPDGLDAYRALLGPSFRASKRGGLLVLEIGFDQADAVRRLCVEAGFVGIEVQRDHGGNDRVVSAFKP